MYATKSNSTSNSRTLPLRNQLRHVVEGLHGYMNMNMNMHAIYNFMCGRMSFSMIISTDWYHSMCPKNQKNISERKRAKMLLISCAYKNLTRANINKSSCVTVFSLLG